MNSRTTPERQVLGAALNDPAAAASLRVLLPAEAFQDQTERRLYLAIVACLEARAVPNMISVCDQDKTLSPSFVAEVSGESPGGHNLEYFSRIVLESHMRNQVVQIAGRASREAAEGSDPFDIVAGFQRELAGVLVSDSISTHAGAIVPGLVELLGQYQRGEAPDAEPTGFEPLDERIIGFPRSNLTILASTSGMGKTTFVADMVRRYVFSERKYPALVISAEMTSREFMYRVATNVARANGETVRRGKAEHTDYAALRMAAQKIAETGLLHIDDTTRPDMRRIHAVAMRIAVEHGGVGTIFVDYDQKLEPPDRRASKEEQVFDIAVGLKDLGKEFEAPVVALSQYTEDDRPKWPSDGALRYSRGKFHEAATVLHWYWPHYWRRKGFSPDAISAAHPSQPYEGSNQAHIVYSKNRFGGTGFFDLKFDAPSGRLDLLPSTVARGAKDRDPTLSFGDSEDLPF